MLTDRLEHNRKNFDIFNDRIKKKTSIEKHIRSNY